MIGEAGDRLWRDRGAGRQAVSHPGRVETVEAPDRANAIRKPVDRPLVGRINSRRERLILLGDPLRIKTLRERRRRGIVQFVAAVKARRIVNADVEDLLQRVFGEEFDLLVAIVAQAIEFSKARARAIIRQRAEISAILSMRTDRRLARSAPAAPTLDGAPSVRRGAFRPSAWRPPTPLRCSPIASDTEW